MAMQQQRLQYYDDGAQQKTIDVAYDPNADEEQQARSIAESIHRQRWHLDADVGVGVLIVTVCTSCRIQCVFLSGLLGIVCSFAVFSFGCELIFVCPSRQRPDNRQEANAGDDDEFDAGAGGWFIRLTHGDWTGKYETQVPLHHQQDGSWSVGQNHSFIMARQRLMNSTNQTLFHFALLCCQTDVISCCTMLSLLTFQCWSSRSVLAAVVHLD